jgi:hypothetical protein
VSVPDSFDVDVSGGLATAVSGGLALNVTNVPKLSIGVDPLDVSLRPLDVSLRPIDLWVGLKEVPRIRGHLPANFSFCVSVFGREIVTLRLCGEAQIITEPYRPSPCEVCSDDQRLRPVLKLTTQERS